MDPARSQGPGKHPRVIHDHCRTSMIISARGSYVAACGRPPRWLQGHEAAVDWGDSRNLAESKSSVGCRITTRLQIQKSPLRRHPQQAPCGPATGWVGPSRPLPTCRRSWERPGALPNVSKGFGDVSSDPEGPQSSRSRTSGNPGNVEALILLK